MQKIPFNLRKWETGLYKVVTRNNSPVSELKLYDSTLISEARLVGVVNKQLYTWYPFDGTSADIPTNLVRDLFLVLPSIYAIVDESVVSTDLPHLQNMLEGLHRNGYSTYKIVEIVSL